MTDLYLTGLSLVELLPEIWQLTNLKTLDLSWNNLTSLPPEIGQLTNLQELWLSNNPLESPPPEIVEQGIEAILAYLRDRLESAGSE